MNKKFSGILKHNGAPTEINESFVCALKNASNHCESNTVQNNAGKLIQKIQDDFRKELNYMK